MMSRSDYLAAKRQRQKRRGQVIVKEASASSFSPLGYSPSKFASRPRVYAVVACGHCRDDWMAPITTSGGEFVCAHYSRKDSLNNKDQIMIFTNTPLPRCGICCSECGAVSGFREQAVDALQAIVDGLDSGEVYSLAIAVSNNAWEVIGFERLRDLCEEPPPG